MLSLVLLPGIDGTGDLFQPLVEKLSANVKARILSYPPGMPSSIDDLESQVRDVLPTDDDYVLLGESFSSPIAIRIAAQRPEGMRGLILCGGFARSPVQGWRRQMLIGFAPLLSRVPHNASNIQRWLLHEDASPETYEMVRSALKQVDPEVLADRLRQVLRTEVTHLLPTIDVPILYLQATQDKLFGPECLEQIQRANPSVQSLAIDAPHLLLQTQPATAAGAIQAFMFLCGQPS